MAFNLFKKKPKKDKHGAGILPPKPKLKPLAKPGIPEVPKMPKTNVPEIPPLNPPISTTGETPPPPIHNIPKGVTPPVQSGDSIPEIPPINAPEMPPIQESPIQTPKEPKPIAPIQSMENPAQPIYSKPDIATPAPSMGMGEAIKAPNIDNPFMTPIGGGAKEISAPIKEDVEDITPFAKKEEKTETSAIDTGDELPSFPESGSSGDDGEIPSPPAYFSRMGEIREDVEGEEGIRHRLLKKPIFVEVNDYKKIIEEIDSIKKDSKKSKDITESLEDLKTKTESKLKVWNKELEKIQRNLVFMDKVLFEESG